MIELVIDSVGDTYINSDNETEKYGGGVWVQAKAGQLIVLLKPHIGNIADRTVLDGYLVGRAAKATVIQDLTVKAVRERWVQNRINYKRRPSTTNTGAVTETIPVLAAGEAFTIPGLGPIMQAVADGTDWFGLEVTTTATTAQAFWSTESGEPSWELHLVLSDAMDAPTNLRPDGGAVSTPEPVLAWEPIDDGEGDANEQAWSQVQVDTPATGVEPDQVTPDYDSGWQANPDPQWALAGVHTLVGAGPHYWRVRTSDADGIDADAEWSDWAEFPVTTELQLVLDSPTGPFGDPTPTVLAHLVGGTLTAWRGRVTGPDRSDVRARTGLVVQDGGTIAWTLPFREERLDAGIVGTTETAFWTKARKVLRDDEGGWLYLRAFDDQDRAIAVGEKGYADLWFPLNFDNDLGVTPPTGLTVTDLNGPDDPRKVWQWSHNEAADTYAVGVDGETVARLTLDDLDVNAGVYTWPNDHGIIPPMAPHTLSVHALDGGQRSEPAEITGYTHNTERVWVIPDADVDPIVLSGLEFDDWVREDFMATYTTSTGDQVDITYGQPGLANTFTGFIDNRGGDAAAWAQVAAVRKLRKSRNRLAQVVWVSRSITVRVRSIDVTPVGDTLANNLLHKVPVSFVQLDED